MSALVESALEEWGLQGASYRLIAARENAVYEIKTGQTLFALRVHRSGYRSDAELRSELAWMAAASAGGISVPKPIPSRSDTYLCVIENRQLDVLSWLDGQTMADLMPGLSGSDRGDLFYKLGAEMARLHAVSDAWTPEPGFTRVSWDADGLVGSAPVWDRFWENPHLTQADKDQFIRFRDAALQCLKDVGPTLDYGLIHADLVPANVLFDEGATRMIDFDDGGYGYRLFDVATALLKHIDEPDYPDLRKCLIEGYLSIRAIDCAELDLFVALRAATYVGWNITRMDEGGGIARNERFIVTLRELTGDFSER